MKRTLVDCCGQIMKSDALSVLFVGILLLGALSLDPPPPRPPYCKKATPCEEAMGKGSVTSPSLGVIVA